MNITQDLKEYSDNVEQETENLKERIDLASIDVQNRRNVTVSADANIDWLEAVGYAGTSGVELRIMPPLETEVVGEPFYDNR